MCTPLSNIDLWYAPTSLVNQADLWGTQILNLTKLWTEILKSTDGSEPEEQNGYFFMDLHL